MCNPRRIEITLCEDINETWRDEIEDQVTVHRQVEAAIERTIPLRDRLGQAARAELEDIFRQGFRGWMLADNGQFTLPLGMITLGWDPESGELAVRAEMAEVVEATARGTAVAEAQVRAAVTAAGEGKYYDDGWGGHTQEKAEGEAQENAEEGLRDAKAEAIEEQTREAREAAQAEAADAASRQASAEAASKAAEREAQLRRELMNVLDQAGDLVRAEVAALVGEVMRRGVLRVVRVNGGRLLAQHEDETSIMIEAEI
ncbi:MAG: hypothetical protein GY856_48790 [bacterium]|nr:hypothetical protein [bacterium]